MLQTGLVVHHDVAVVLGILGHLGGEKAVDKAVAALALGAAHDQKVIVVGLSEGVTELHLGVICLAHAGRDGALEGHLRLGDLLTDVAQGVVHLYPQHFIQIGIGVGVHGQDRTVLLLAEILDEHAADSGLAYAAFAGQRNGLCHSCCSPFGVSSAGTFLRFRRGIEAVDQMRSTMPDSLTIRATSSYLLRA